MNVRMNMKKGALAVLIVGVSACVSAFASETYVIPASANLNGKVTISVDRQSGDVEFLNADGDFKSAQVLTTEAQDPKVELAFWNDEGAGYQTGCCAPPPPPPYYYDQRQLYANPCGRCGYEPAPQPRVHVRKVRERERDIYEYDVVPQRREYRPPVYVPAYPPRYGSGGYVPGYDGY